MKKFPIFVFVSLSPVAVGIAAGAAFTAGDLAVYRVGTGSAALSSGSTAVYIDEYSPTGSLVQSIALPTAASGINNPLTSSGTATSEGNLSLSADGTHLLLPGYDAAPGVSGIANTATTADPRDIGVIDGLGNIDTSTTTTAFSANNIRGVASPDGITLYAVGANSGVISLIDGSTGTAGTTISSTNANNRVLQIVGGQLYVSTGSGTLRIATVGSGVPTTSGQTATEVAGVPVGVATTSSVAGSPVGGSYGFVFDSSTGGVSPDTLYIADNGYFGSKTSNPGVIEKYELVSGAYQADGFVNLQGVTGLVGSSSIVGGVPTENLYATTPTGIYSLSDSGLGALTATPTLIASAGTNEAFRGIAFTPTAVPEPTGLAALAVGALGLLKRRR